MNKEFLIQFEEKIASLFNNAKIRAPIHLYSGTEDIIIEIFKDIDIHNDWVCCTWRNHYQALLKGISPDLLESKIIKGKSMVMNLPQYKFICSSIVGGIPSIAVGIALSIKLQGKKDKVWCWVGDMSAETGAFHESYKYALNHDLPITFIIEDNKKSVCTPTNIVWNREKPYYLNEEYKCGIYRQDKLIYYEYTNNLYKHAGTNGKMVKF